MRLFPLTRARRLPAALLLTLVAAAWAGSLYGWARLPAVLPDAADLRSVAARLEDAGRPGDAVLLAPVWAERLRLFAPEGLPVLALPPDDPDLAAVSRLWVLTHPDLPWWDPDETLATLTARFGPPSGAERIGPLTLTTYAPDPPEVLWSLRAQLPRARVLLGETACRWRERGRGAPRWQCPRGDWNYVAAEIRELDYVPRACVWAHPVADAPLRIRLEDVPLRGQLVLRAGFIGESALDPALAPAHIAVSAGAQRAQATVPQAPGFPATRIPLDGGGRGPLELAITTERAGRRHLCIDAWIEAAP